MWTCPKCGAKVDPSFDVCWQCGTSPEGVEDPSFVRADDAPPIEDPPVDDEEKRADELTDEFGSPLPDLVACYMARDTLEARFLADQLMQQGIPAVADKHDLGQMVGGGPSAIWGEGPRIRVRPEDAARARAWLDAYEERQKAKRVRGEQSRPGRGRGAHAMWTCPKCGAKVDPSFDVCWQCGTSLEGVEDPSFVRADDAPPIDDPLYDPIAEPVPAPVSPEAELAGSPDRSEMVECYLALSLMEAKFLADQLTAEGIPALADTQDLQDALGTWQGNPRVYCPADDLPRARAWLEEYDRRRKADPGRHLEE